MIALLAFAAGMGFGIAGTLAWTIRNAPPPDGPDVIEDDDDSHLPESIRAMKRQGIA